MMGNIKAANIIAPGVLWNPWFYFATPHLIWQKEIMLWAARPFPLPDTEPLECFSAVSHIISQRAILISSLTIALTDDNICTYIFDICKNNA